MGNNLIKFNTEAAQKTFRRGDNYIEPHVSCTSDGKNVKYNRRMNFVDLGLTSGNLWATCNLGASKPEEFGNYYAWGELTTKESYTWDNYKFGVENDPTKYDDYQEQAVLDYCDDVIYVKYGTLDVDSEYLFQMPDFSDFQELITECTWTAEQVNGVSGYRISKNNKSIFMPITGTIYGTQIYEDSFGYWSCQYGNDDNSALALAHDNQDAYIYPWTRVDGMPVRGVAKRKFNYVDLGLTSGTLWADRNYLARTINDTGAYYAWGELKEKDTYTLENYRFAIDNSSQMSKYNNNDEKTTLDDQDDIIIQEIGNGWHMPSVDDITELLDECTFSLDEQVNGLICTGPNNNTIYFPWTSYKDEYGLSIGGWFVLWCNECFSTTPSYDPLYGHVLYGTESYNIDVYGSTVYRANGCPIRPVKYELD